MEYRSLGSSGLMVSEFALGTMTFGAESDERVSHALLDRFVESGGNLVDTADVYSSGASEEIIGRWLAKRGSEGDVIIATKGRFSMGDGPNQRGSSRRHLQVAVEASLRRLGVNAIDLYQLHGWDPSTPLSETLAALDDFVTAGKIRYLGVSNFTGWQLQKAIMGARSEGFGPVVSVQPQYSLLSREVEWEIVPQCIEEGLGIFPWSPLAGGWLTGKYEREVRPSGTTRLGEDPERGVEAYDLRNVERTWRVLGEVRAVASKRGVTPSQVALNWLRDRPQISAVILGARTVAQLDENLGALKWHLEPEEREALTVASAPGIPLYPYGFIEHYCEYDIWERLGTRSEPPAIS